MNGTKSYNILIIRKIIIVTLITIFIVISSIIITINSKINEIKAITINNEKIYLMKKFTLEMNQLKKKKKQEINNLRLRINKLFIKNKFYALEIKNKTQDMNDLTLRINKLFIKNKFYVLEIKNKTQDMNDFISILSHIENSVGIQEHKKYSLIKRAKLIKITFAEKQHTLRLIPNGSPLKKIFYTDKFGYRKHPIKKRKIFHKGVDLRAKIKTPILATADGIVKFIQPIDKGGFGLYITISHNYGFETMYAHLSKIKVKRGDVIRKGEVIALSGNSGKSTGAHLHYEVKYVGRVLNPKNFIKWNMKNYDIIFKKERGIKWNSLIDLINQQKKNQVQQSLQKVQI